MAMVTSLAPMIGYDRAAEIAKESAKTGRTVREICARKKILPEAELKRALDPIAMTEPGGKAPAAGSRSISPWLPMSNGPQFSGGEYRDQMPESYLRATIAFYRDTLGLPLIEEKRRAAFFILVRTGSGSIACRT